MTLDNTFVYNFGKFRMVLDKHDPDVSRQIQEHGWYVDERFDIEVFQKHLKTGMTFVDLGANVGFYTFLARSIIGQKGRVFAFEPYPRNAELIRASIGENSFHNNVTLVEAAVSDKNGKASLYLSPDASSENSLLDLEFRYDDDAKKEEGLGRKGQQEKRAITVDVVTVDDYFEKKVGDTKVDFIKMDIDNDDRMILMLEFWPNGFRKDNHDPYEFLETLAKSPEGGGGFDIQLIDNIKQEVYRVDVEEMKRIEKSRMEDISTQNEFMKIWGWYTNLLCTRE
jgi:FkbM family methyltransferase